MKKCEVVTYKKDLLEYKKTKTINSPFHSWRICLKKGTEDGSLPTIKIELRKLWVKWKVN